MKSDLLKAKFPNGQKKRGRKPYKATPQIHSSNDSDSSEEEPWGQGHGEEGEEVKLEQGEQGEGGLGGRGWVGDREVDLEGEGGM